MFGNNVKIVKRKQFIKFIKKNCYISIPVITILTIVMLYYINVKYELNFSLDYADDISTLIGISGTLIGFLFTAITIFLSLNKDSKFMERVFRYGHHKIFSNCIWYGIILLSINIMLWLFKAHETFIIITFILGLEETIMAVYYTYILSFKSSK